MQKFKVGEMYYVGQTVTFYQTNVKLFEIQTMIMSQKQYNESSSSSKIQWNDKFSALRAGGGNWIQTRV